MPMISKLQSYGLVKITFACSRHVEQWPELQSHYGIPRFTTDYRELVESNDVDIVLILTNMQSHAEICRHSLAAGKHTLVEKPFATNLEDGLELVKLARQSARLLMPAPFVVLSPTFQAVKQVLKEGKIGRVFLARARYGWKGPSWGRWFYREGAGVIFDLGVYNLTTLTGLLGPAKRVVAFAGIAIPQRIVNGELISVEAEDNAQILLDFGNSCFASVTTGFTIQQYRSPAIELYGTEGTLQILGDDWAPNGYELWQNSLQTWQVYPETDPHWSWCDGLRHLVECVQKGSSPIVTPDHALHVLEIMLLAKESAKNDCVKELTTSFDTLP